MARPFRNSHARDRLLLGSGVVLLLASASLFVAPGFACDEQNPCVPGFNPCETNLRCENGVCVVDRVRCTDDDPCTINERCDVSRGCVSDVKCPQDGLACNGEEYCCNTILCIAANIYGQCRQRQPNCDDRDPCTCDSCAEPSGCRHVPRNCDDGNQCTVDSCDPNATDNCAPGLGCLHETIPGCCRGGADCADPCRSGRACVGNVCTDGTPVSCDDGDPLTADACDPVAGCTHSSSSTLPGARCRADTDCPPDTDPCTTEGCDPATGCVSRAVAGFDRLACICGRPDPASCAATSLPRGVTKKRSRACSLIARAATKPKRARKLIGRSGKLLAKAQRGIGKAKQLDPTCQQDLGNLLADGVARAGTLRSEL